MLQFFKLCLSFIVGQPIIIPFDFSRTGAPFVNIKVPWIRANESFPFEVKPKGSSCIFFETFENDDQIEETVSVLLEFPNTYPQVSMLDPELYIVAPRSRLRISESLTCAIRQLGIGAGSFFMNEFGSVNFFRNTQHLVLNDTSGDFFRYNCASNRVFRVPLVDFGGVRADWVMTVDMGDWNPRPFRATTWLTSDEEILHVPADSMDTISAIIERDLIYDGRIQNCENVRRRLPRIVLTFLDISSTIERETGQLILYPEDYTRMEDDGSCDLLLGTGVTTNNRARFNPLLVPGVNVRFTGSEIFLCDSVDIS